MISGEEEARNWLASALNVPRETLDRLNAFAELLRQENERQNLVARSTLDHIWARHIADSAQLLAFAPAPDASWLDLGTGAGFPGLIVAALHQGPVTLVESRRLRVDFLERAATVLQVHPRILHNRTERLPPEPFDVISARAYGQTAQTFATSHPFSTEITRWILPKGRTAAIELEEVKRAWQGEFRIEPSLTDSDAGIIVADGVRPRRQRKSS